MAIIKKLEGMESTGEILKKYISKNTISQKELAKKIENDESYISSIVNDKKAPSRKVLDKFINILNISEEDQLKIYSFEKYRRIDEEWRLELIEQEIYIKQLEAENKELKGYKKIKDFIVQQEILKNIKE